MRKIMTQVQDMARNIISVLIQRHYYILYKRKRRSTPDASTSETVSDPFNLSTFIDPIRKAVAGIGGVFGLLGQYHYYFLDINNTSGNTWKN